MAESFPMIGGDGTNSYTNNSHYQRLSSNTVKEMMDEAIAEEFDVLSLISASSSKTITIADLGCSVGPNTFFTMKDIIDAVAKKCHSQGLASEDVEYQVLFNDHVSNDFNTLFTSLPSDRKYYAVGVPGSFHDRLFPSSSLDFVYSSFALHWLSRVPREVTDQNSPAWNKGRIQYGSASDEVASAYAAQFAMDMEMFLNARAKEMVSGGLMVLIMLGLPHGVHRSEIPMSVIADFLASILMDMVNSGSITEAQLDSFNIPAYAPTVEEMTEAIGKNGCFSIVTIEDIPPNIEAVALSCTENVIIKMIRSVTEEVFRKCFEKEVVDELFERALKKTTEVSKPLYSAGMKGNQLFAILKRK